MADNLPGFGSFLRTKSFFIPAFVYLVLGFALAFLPLTDYLGLEFSLVVGIFAGFLSGPIAVSYLHRRLPDASPSERRAAAFRIGATGLWIEALLINYAAVLFSLAGLIFVGLLSQPCAPLRGAGFFLLLPLVSVAYASSWGLAAYGLLNRPRLAKILVTLFALMTLAGSAVQFVTGLAVWVYNPFFGHFPGPIYDEAASPSLALVTYRLANLAEAWLIVLLTGAVWWWRLRREGQAAKWKIGAIFLFVVLLATTLGINRNRFALGFDIDQAHLLKKLDGYVRTEHFDIHYPRRAIIERQIDRIALDHEFYFAQIEKELGIRYPHRITSWIYPSEKMKKKWIGAGGTEYADCAKHQMHLNFEDFPIRILHHEMIHVMLSDYGLPVLGFSAKIAVTEGMAVAFGGPEHWGMDLDRWAAGMKAIDRLPRISKILGLGFWKESGARSYVAAGSFIRFCASKPENIRKLLAAYKWGDIDAQLGDSLKELEKQWRAHLTEIEEKLAPEEIERARYRFGFKSIFEMRCPRELGRLLEEADEKEKGKYYFKADLLYRKAASLDGDNVRIARLRLHPLLSTGRFAVAEKLAEDIAAAQGTPDHPAIDENGREVGSQLVAQEAEMVRAALFASRREKEKAIAVYRTILANPIRDSLVREAACALYAYEHPEVETVILDYLTNFRNDDTYRWNLLETMGANPNDPVVNYLIARRMLSDNAYLNAIRALSTAISGGLPHAALQKEAWNGLGFAHFMLGNLEEAGRAFLEAAELEGDAVSQNTKDWLARIATWDRLRETIKAINPEPLPFTDGDDAPDDE